MHTGPGQGLYMTLGCQHCRALHSTALLLIVSHFTEKPEQTTPGLAPRATLKDLLTWVCIPVQL